MDCVQLGKKSIDFRAIFDKILSYEEGCFSITPFEYDALNPIWLSFSYDNGLSWLLDTDYTTNPTCGFSTLVPMLFRAINDNGIVISNTIEVLP